MAEIAVTLKQHEATASMATIRDHQFVIDRPEDKGGHNAGPMGGELLLASVGGCFMSNLRAAIAAREGIRVENIAVTVTATLSDDMTRFSTVHLHVTAVTDGQQLQKLVTIAERACIAANTIRGSVELTVSSG
ncbi:MAG: OsmC family protein [Acidobacteriota bacterium]|nr:OsmC family protein [Acidobacteriota bacterium]